MLLIDGPPRGLNRAQTEGATQRLLDMAERGL